MIIIAWTACFHAIYYKRKRRPWYKSSASSTGRGVRYARIDGEPKHWDLAKCLKEYYGDKNPPERKNLEFLIGLRNKVEHRHLPDLDASLYGECQAALLNLEDFIVSNFGARYALTEQLAVSLQFSRTIPSEKRKASQRLAVDSVKTVREYVERFRGNLSSSVLNSIKYSFNVFLVPRVVNRQNIADAAVTFIPIDEASKDELQRLEKLNVLIKEKHIPITNLDLLKPSQVVEKLQENLPYRINMHTHTEAWRFFGVRPVGDSPRPERTRSEYCMYDVVHGDYLYTKAWVNLLLRELRDEERFEEIVGQTPTPVR